MRELHDALSLAWFARNQFGLGFFMPGEIRRTGESDLPTVLTAYRRGRVNVGWVVSVVRFAQSEGRVKWWVKTPALPKVVNEGLGLGVP